MPLSDVFTAMNVLELGLAVAAGGVLGLLISLLGGGGALFLFPVLVYGFHQGTASAAGTSLISVLGAALIGLVGHWRGGRVNVRVALVFGACSMAASVLGSQLHHFVSDRATTFIFGTVLLVTAMRMFGGSRLASTVPPGSINWKLLVPLGLAVGLLSGFLGVGGGFLIVPGLIWGAHLAIHEAVGTSVAVIVLTTISGAFAHLAQGSVNPALAVAIGAGALGGATVGVPLSTRIPPRPLRAGFAVMVLVVGLGVTLQAALG